MFSRTRTTRISLRGGKTDYNPTTNCSPGGPSQVSGEKHDHNNEKQKNYDQALSEVTTNIDASETTHQPQRQADSNTKFAHH
jgi:hypothetical protein